MPTEEKKHIASQFLKYLRMIFYLMSLCLPSVAEKGQLDVLRRKWAVFMARHLQGFHRSHYLHKCLGHSIECIDEYGTIANYSTSSAESQNKIMREYLLYHSRKNQDFELVDTLKRLWLRSSKQVEALLVPPRKMSCSTCEAGQGQGHTAKNHDKVTQEKAENQALIDEIAALTT